MKPTASGAMIGNCEICGEAGTVYLLDCEHFACEKCSRHVDGKIVCKDYAAVDK